MKKILIYNPSDSIPTFIQILIKALSDGNHVFVISKTNSTKLNDSNIEQFSLGSSVNKFSYIVNAIKIHIRSFIINPKKFIEIIFKKWFQKISISRKIKESNILNLVSIINPDIIHIQWVSQIVDFESIISEHKIVVSLRGRLINVTPKANPKIKELYQKVFPSISQFHAVSNSIKKEGLKYGAISKKTDVIYSAIEFEILDKVSRNSFSKNNNIEIISVGRFNWKKGYNYAIDAIKILLKKGYDINYTVIAGQYDEEILYMINDSKINNNVDLVDKMKQTDVFKKIKESDIFFLPSVEEGIANVVYESMGLKTLVVSSDCCGMGEIIKNNETGFLFKNRDVNDMVHKIETCIRLNEKNKSNIINNAYTLVKSEHNVKLLSKKMNELYEKVLQS